MCILDMLSIWKYLSRFLLNLILDNLIEVCSLTATIIIAVVNFNFLKKQDKKNDKKDMNDRKSKLQSILTLSNKIELILHMDSVYNYTQLLPHKNVLFKKENTANGATYALDLDVFFKNMTDIFPNKVCVYTFKFWENSVDKKEQISQLRLEFTNYILGYKEVAVNGNKESCFSILCCCDKQDLDLIRSCQKENRIFNFVFEMSVVNSCNIANKCNVRGKCKLHTKEDLSSGNLGGTKEKLTFEVVESYLM